MGGNRGNPPGRVRPRGNIETRPGGSRRVRVYAGVDVLTGRDLYLRRTVPAGPKADAEAERVRDELVRQVLENRQPRTNALLNQLLDKHLETADVELRVKQTLLGYKRKHIEPFIGRTHTIHEVDAESLESFYAELRRCRDHCSGPPTVRHRTADDHTCDRRCRRHQCNPLAAWTIRKIHYLISAAYESGKRWNWISINPTTSANKPAAPPPDPQPPSPEDAAALVNECWRWDDLGPYVWLAMTTGARRGELCALRWEHLKVQHEVRGDHECLAAGCHWSLEIRRAIAQAVDDGFIWEKATKTHQKRFVALDPETVAILMEHKRRCEEAAVAFGATLAKKHFMFPATPTGREARKPSSMSGRFKRCAKRLEIDTCLKNLRHYSATELIISGVDVRTVAGRLGHGSGGTTTLKVYAAWVALADQRASAALINRMPQRPSAPIGDPDRARNNPRKTHERLAAGLHTQWVQGQLAADTELTVKDLAAAHHVTEYAAHQAILLLKRWGVVDVRNGHRSRVLRHSASDHSGPEPGDSVDVAPIGATSARHTSAAPHDDRHTETARTQLTLELIHLGTSVRTMDTHADPTDFAVLQKLMVDAVRRAGGDHTLIGEYEMTVTPVGRSESVTTVVVAA